MRASLANILESSERKKDEQMVAGRVAWAGRSCAERAGTAGEKRWECVSGAWDVSGVVDQSFPRSIARMRYCREEGCDKNILGHFEGEREMYKAAANTILDLYLFPNSIHP